jgi:di/tricarboxylate transporter
LQAALVLILLGVVIVLLASERLREDLVAMLALAALVVFGILTPEQALSGFSNQATVAVACMFLLSAGLQASGFVQFAGDRLLKSGPHTTTVLVLLCAVVIGPVSAFINNTAAVAVFLPVALRASHGSRVSPSRVLMPLSFFAMLGGMCTLIGTSTNILVSSLAAQHDIRPFGMFEFAPVGLVLLAAGTVYLLVFGRKLLPERVQAESLTAGFHLNRYLSEVVVLPGSSLVGKSLLEAKLGERYDLEVLALIRPNGDRLVPGEVDRLHEGDLLLIKAAAAALVQLRDRAGIGIKPGRHPDDADLRSADSVLMEAVIAPNSPLEGRTMKGVDFRHRYGATALAIRRHGEDIQEKIGRVRLRLGDEMLILAPRLNLERLKRETDFVILQELDVPVMNPVRALIAVAIVAAVVATAALRLYTIAEAAVVGSVLMVLSGCLPVRKIYRDIDWRVIFLIAGLVPMGIALESSGAAGSLIMGLLKLIGGWGPTVVLSAFFLVASLLTGFMSNAATAALLAPLAITCARALGVEERPFLMALAFAASAAFYTPVGYQTNLLVYGPGGYRFMDFVKVGVPLNLVIWVLATLMIPWLFPFH